MHAGALGPSPFEARRKGAEHLRVTDQVRSEPMQKWNLIIDVAECTNCQLCTLAAMDEYVGNDWPGIAASMPRHGHRWIDILQKERGQVTGGATGQSPMIDIAYVPTLCNHCDNAPCLAKGGDAVKKRDDGIVIIDPVNAKGRKDLVESCPYGHIWWNEELQLPQIWPFDAHLIDQGWQQTRGQQACPTGAMRAIKVEDKEMARLAREQQLEVMKPEAGTKPRVYYKNLWRYTKCFIGGSVSAEMNGMVDCVEGATVHLVKDGVTIETTVTDNYGDFKFDKLDENSGRYTVEVLSNGRTRTVDAELGASLNLGEIRL
jgi:Fe-S-cluster-containing dehydrogenase component